MLHCKLSKWIPEIMMTLGGITLLEVKESLGIVVLLITIAKALIKWKKEIDEEKKKKEDEREIDKRNIDF